MTINNPVLAVPVCVGHMVTTNTYKSHFGDLKLSAKLLCHYYLMQFEVKTRRTSIVTAFNTTFVSHIKCTAFVQYISHKTRTVMTDECCFFSYFFFTYNFVYSVRRCIIIILRLRRLRHYMRVNSVFGVPTRIL